MDSVRARFNQHPHDAACALRALLLISAVALPACDERRPRDAQKPQREPVARVESSVTLPHGDGRAHILVVPTGYHEAARCVVAVTPGMPPSVACTKQDLDFTSSD